MSSRRSQTSSTRNVPTITSTVRGSSSSSTTSMATLPSGPTNSIFITSTVFLSSESSPTTAIVFDPARGANTSRNNSALTEQVNFNNSGSSGGGLLLAIIIACLIIVPLILLYLYRSYSLLRRSKTAMNGETLSRISSLSSLSSLERESNGNNGSKDRLSQLAVRKMAVSIAESVPSEDDIYLRSTSSMHKETEVGALKRIISLPSFGYAPPYQPSQRGNSVVSGASDNSYYEQTIQNNPSFIRNANGSFRYSQNFDHNHPVRYQHSARYPELHYHSGYSQEYPLVNHPNHVYTQFLKTNPPSSHTSSDDTSSSGTLVIGQPLSANPSPPSRVIAQVTQSLSPLLLPKLDLPS